MPLLLAHSPPYKGRRRLGSKKYTERALTSLELDFRNFEGHPASCGLGSNIHPSIRFMKMPCGVFIYRRFHKASRSINNDKLLCTLLTARDKCPQSQDYFVARMQYKILYNSVSYTAINIFSRSRIRIRGVAGSGTPGNISTGLGVSVSYEP